MVHKNTDNKNIVIIYPKNFTQPILVKKSYRYRGTPPRIKIKKHKHITNFKVMAKVKLVEKT